jgi:hypothetical protein
MADATALQASATADDKYMAAKRFFIFSESKGLVHCSKKSLAGFGISANPPL